MSEVSQQQNNNPDENKMSSQQHHEPSTNEINDQQQNDDNPEIHEQSSSRMVKFQYSLAFLFYVSEVITWFLRTNSNTQTAYVCQIVQFVINVLFLTLLSWVNILQYDSLFREKHWAGFIFCAIPFVGLCTCDLIPGFSFQFGIDFCGYLFLIQFWSITREYTRTTIRPQIKGCRVGLCILHSIFFLAIVTANFSHESNQTVSQLGAKYIASIAENILLFELLHLIFENIDPKERKELVPLHH